MRTPTTLAAWLAALALGAVALLPRPVAADTYNLTQCFITNCPVQSSYGAVTVSAVNADEVSVDLQLASGEVFAFGGAGKPLLFDLSGNPAVSVTGLPTGYTFTHQQMTMADGTGKWDYFIDCPSACGSGTSNGVSGPLTFDVTLATGITPASFIKNNKNLFFATDIGIPTASGFATGDVGSLTATPVPLPPAQALTLGGLVLLALLLRRRAADAGVLPAAA